MEGVEPTSLAALVSKTSVFTSFTTSACFKVPIPGLEPGRLSAAVFETAASANSTIPAFGDVVTV